MNDDNIDSYKIRKTQQPVRQSALFYFTKMAAVVCAIARTRLWQPRGRKVRKSISCSRFAHFTDQFSRRSTLEEATS